MRSATVKGDGRIDAATALAERKYIGRPRSMFPRGRAAPRPARGQRSICRVVAAAQAMRPKPSIQPMSIHDPVTYRSDSTR